MSAMKKTSKQQAHKRAKGRRLSPDSEVMRSSLLSQASGHALAERAGVVVVAENLENKL